jgi:RNA polymerase sigma factor (sigma-70 family)
VAIARHDGDLRAWLFTIQRNLFLNGVRQRARRGRHIGQDALEDIPSCEGLQDASLGARDVLASLDLLSEDQRSVLLLVAVEDLSYADAAHVLDAPVGTVMSRLSRAREKMRSYLENGRPAVLRVVK